MHKSTGIQGIPTAFAAASVRRSPAVVIMPIETSLSPSPARIILVFALSISLSSAFQVPLNLGTGHTRESLSMCSSHEGTSNAESLALRRVFLQRVAFAAALFPSLVSAEAPIEVDAEKRGSQRGGALVEQDFPFFKGKYPPRVLVFEELPKQEGSKPIYNAWGACVQDSCSYVPLKQRYDGYKKYKDSTTRASSILQGALLQSATGSAFDVDEGKVFEKALRRGVLFANILLISENYGTSNEALAARFYVNEAYFGMVQLQKEAGAGNTAAAKEWWLLCRDSWNSYLTLINRAIVPKVGDKFPLISTSP